MTAEREDASTDVNRHVASGAPHDLDRAAPGYDVIGDVHGYADKLAGLLDLLGYVFADGAHRHPAGRQAVFVGDLIDTKGPLQCESVDVVRAMCDAGSAQMVLGNHEFNAVAWATPDPDQPGEFLRPHGGHWGPKNREQHQTFLAAVGEGSERHREYIEWFRTLPLWLELDGLRVVHACWSTEHMRILDRYRRGDRWLTDELIVDGSREGADAFAAIETVLKGPDIELPDGYAYLDAYGFERCRARQRWWVPDATTLRTAAIIPTGGLRLRGAQVAELPDTPLPADVHQPYADDVPVLFGHYWRTDGSEDTALATCVDRSAGRGQALVAYRWHVGDRALSDDRLVGFPGPTGS